MDQVKVEVTEKREQLEEKHRTGIRRRSGGGREDRVKWEERGKRRKTRRWWRRGSITSCDLALWYLDGLPVLLKDVDPHYCFVELWIQGLDDLIVKMLLHRNKNTQKNRNVSQRNMPIAKHEGKGFSKKKKRFRHYCHVQRYNSPDWLLWKLH